MKHSRRLLSRAFFVATISLIAVACTQPSYGGGGGPANVAPVAAITASTTSGPAPLEVDFDSSGSSDSDGTITTYAWTFGDSGTSADPNPTYTYTTAGTYTATLLITDDDGATDLDTVEITVSAADDPNGRYVATTGTDDSTCSSSAAPCLTVNYAVGQATAGDQIYVAAGTYAEIVAPNKDDLSFIGANAGVAAGVDAGTRGAESIVKGFRNPGNPGTTSLTISIDGFTIDPQGDAALISATLQPLVWLRGGSSTSFVNNVLNGADTFVPTCAHTCTTMTDSAFVVQSGAVTFDENLVTNFRRPININQPIAAPATVAAITDNVITGVTSRALSIGPGTGSLMPGQTVTGNVFTSNHTSPSGPAGMTVSNGSNVIDGNSFDGFATGVFIDICKKFATRDNSVTDNTFNNVGTGVGAWISQPETNCTKGAFVGNLQWAVNGGDINGLVVTGNSFLGTGSNGFVHAPNWATYVAPNTTGPIDVSCNFWNDVTGPTYSGNPGGTGKTLVASSVAGDSAPTFSPWNTTDGGACDGTL